MFGNDATTTSKELTATITALSSELRASVEQLETTNKELAIERQKFAFLSQVLETAVARLHYREKSRRRVLSLLLTVVLSAITGAASFAVFLWLYYRGIITLGQPRRVQRQEGS